MILSNQSLKQFASNHMSDYDENLIGASSIDLRISNQLRIAKHIRYPISKQVDPKVLWSDPIEFRSYVIHPGDFVLCSSIEYFSFPEDRAAILNSKSTTGRLGLEHLHSGYVDAGFSGQLTFELMTVKWPFTLVANETYLQLIVMSLDTKTALSYSVNGHYNNQVGPTAHTVV